MKSKKVAVILSYHVRQFLYSNKNLSCLWLPIPQVKSLHLVLVCYYHGNVNSVIYAFCKMLEITHFQFGLFLFSEINNQVNKKEIIMQAK